MWYLQTQRLVLRSFQPKDIAEYALLLAEPALSGTRLPLSAGDRQQLAEHLIITYNDYWRIHGFGIMAGFLCSQEEAETPSALIGTCGLCWYSGAAHPILSSPPFSSEEARKIELVYAFSEAYRGHGLAAEACRTILETGFTKLDISTIFAFVEPWNQSSMRVATKIGMEKIGYQPRKGYHEDLAVFCAKATNYSRYENVSTVSRFSDS